MSSTRRSSPTPVTSRMEDARVAKFNAARQLIAAAEEFGDTQLLQEFWTIITDLRFRLETGDATATAEFDSVMADLARFLLQDMKKTIKDMKKDMAQAMQIAERWLQERM